MKKFFTEFKKFITRGNVVDMAVGVIVGSSFTAIVNGLSNNILKPVINWLLALIFGADSLSEIYTFLKLVNDAEGNPDLTQSIYIDWGAFINAVINFFIVAFVLFCIVKIVNKFREEHKEAKEKIQKAKPTKEERKELKARGFRATDLDALKALRDEKAKKAEEEKKAAEAAAAEAARIEKENNPSAEQLLKDILELLRNK